MNMYENRKKKIRLLQIRNPWGHGEWLGDWSDKSDVWNKYPGIKKKLFSDADDGCFWMSWDDFVHNYTSIGVVDRTMNMQTLTMDFRGSEPCGVFRGFLYGTWKFWCRCYSCARLYFPRSSDHPPKSCTCCYSKQRFKKKRGGSHDSDEDD